MNTVRLEAVIVATKALRYTPQGLPVLEMSLSHHSKQIEAEKPRDVTLNIEAKIMGDTALAWQHEEGRAVQVNGFLSGRTTRYASPVLHIQQIKLLNKG